ncbi:MAG: rhodanese-like domain-containing protein [Rubrobacter sp.]
MKTIDREELKARMDGGGEFLLLEVLSEESYGREHLPGAVRFQDMDQTIGLLPDRSTEVVAYCSNFN